MSRFNFQNTEHKTSAARLEDCPQDGLPEIVMAGRSNVGKSTLINALCGKKSLARVSQNPGKTRLLLYFETDGAFYLTDLPGYGYAKASKEAIESFSSLADAYFSADRPIALVLLLADIRRGVTDQDAQLTAYLEHYDIPYLLVFTKIDKLSKAQVRRQLQLIAQDDRLPEDFPSITLSSRSGEGIKELRGIISEAVLLFGDTS